VEGNGKFERVSGTSIGGGTFWGLGKLLTQCKRLFITYLFLGHSLWVLYRLTGLTSMHFVVQL